jgi:hypothetical protein
VCYQYHDVLHGTDEELLDLYPPQPSPPSSLKSISHGAGKGAFGQVLAGCDISFGFSGFGLREHCVELILSQVPLYDSALF